MEADIYYTGELPSRKWLPWQENKRNQYLVQEFNKAQKVLIRNNVLEVSNPKRSTDDHMWAKGDGRDIISAKKELELTKKFKVEIKPTKKKPTHTNRSHSEDPHAEITATMLGGFF